MDFMETDQEYSGIPTLLDFIADRDLIDTYAKKPNPRPTVPQLIDLILRQANLENPNEPYVRLMLCHRVDVDEGTFLKTRRNRAAKTVALMLASALNWNLSEIEKDLSITMQFCLVQDLMNSVFSSTEYCSAVVDPQNIPQRLLSSFTDELLKGLPDHCLFGLIMYARWILRAQIQRKVPKKPARGGIVSIGAITDPVVLQGLDEQTQGYSQGYTQGYPQGYMQRSSLIWTLFRQISREKVSQISLDLLSEIVKLDRQTFIVPTSASFVIPSSATKVVEEHNWTIGQQISFLEIRLQILFDLALYWLFEGKMSQTMEYLHSFLLLLKTTPIKSLEYVQVDMKVFTNMCKIVGVPVDSSLAEKTPRSMELLPSLKNKLLDILLDDLNVGAIPAYARTSLELELRMSEEPAERAVLQKVRLCNLFRQYTAKISQPTCSDLKSVLSDATVADVDWLRIVLNGGRINGEVRSGVVAKLAFLVDRDLIGTPLKQKIAEFVSDSPRSPSMSPVKGLLDDDVEMIDVKMMANHLDLHHSILGSYMYQTLKHNIHHLKNALPKIPIKDLDSTWSAKIPPTLKASCSPMWNPATVDLVHVIFAKSSELVEQQCFRGARQLLKLMRSDLENVSMKFERNLRWQNTYTDLAENLQFINTVAFTADVRFEAVKRAKKCITETLVMKSPDEEPVPVYVQNLAVMVLFNLEEWEYITEVISMQDQKKKASSSRSLSALFPLIKQLTLACNEYQSQSSDLITQSNGGKTKQATISRQHCMKLWNTVSSILSLSNDPAKPSKLMTSTSSLTAETFWAFVRLLRHKTAIYLLFSCIFRMWNVSTRDSGDYSLITELLWPNNIPLQYSIPPAELVDAVKSMFGITEECDVRTKEIMLIKGDFFYGKREWKNAIRMYLLCGMDGSLPGFVHSPEVVDFGSGILRKLVICFEGLRCYTYVAILCQMMSPVDYDTAMRALGEKVVHDAADEVYRYIWDPLMLEHLAFLLQKWGFLERRQNVVDLLRDPVLTAANPVEVTENVASAKKMEFFEILFDQYVIG